MHTQAEALWDRSTAKKALGVEPKLAHCICYKRDSCHLIVSIMDVDQLLLKLLKLLKTTSRLFNEVPNWAQ